MHATTQAAPARWSRLCQLRPNTPSGTVGYQFLTGDFRGTIETADDWQPIRSVVGTAYRWRVYYLGQQFGSGCASTLAECIDKAERTIADWSKYAPDAQRALLAG